MPARMRSLRMLLEARRRRPPAAPGRRKPPRAPGAEGVPVTPDRPSTLDGGAAAALTFDDCWVTKA